MRLKRPLVMAHDWLGPFEKINAYHVKSDRSVSPMMLSCCLTGKCDKFALLLGVYMNFGSYRVGFIDHGRPGGAFNLHDYDRSSIRCQGQDINLTARTSPISFKNTISGLFKIACRHLLAVSAYRGQSFRAK